MPPSRPVGDRGSLIRGDRNGVALWGIPAATVQYVVPHLRGPVLIAGERVFDEAPEHRGENPGEDLPGDEFGRDVDRVDFQRST